MKYAHIAARLFDTPLLVAKHKLDLILAVVAPRMDLEVEFNAEDAKAASFTGRRDRQYRNAVVLDSGLGVLPVHDALVHREHNAMDVSLSRQSYEGMQSDFVNMINDGSVTRIALDIDSPGGEANGLFDFVDAVYNERGKKPTTAIINEAAFSAAYAIASAADRIVMPRTGGAGSIGVIATHVDQSQRDANEGYKVTHVYAGDRKADFSPHKALSNEATARLQKEVNQLYEVFVDTVARNRNLNADQVRNTKADIFIGQTALEAGLVDQIAPAQATVESEASQASIFQAGGYFVPNWARLMGSVIGEKLRPGVIQAMDDPRRGVVTLTPLADPGQPPASSQPKETPMATEPKDDRGGDVVEIDKARTEGRAEGRADAEAEIAERAAEITSACVLAGSPDLAAELIKSCGSVAEAKAKLFDRAAEQDDADRVVSQHHTNSDDPTENPLVEDAKRRAAAAGFDGRV